MTEREQLVEIMARAIDPLAFSQESTVRWWLNDTQRRKRDAREEATRAIAAAERAGWVFVAPPDGR